MPPEYRDCEACTDYTSWIAQCSDCSERNVIEHCAICGHSTRTPVGTTSSFIDLPFDMGRCCPACAKTYRLVCQICHHDFSINDPMHAWDLCETCWSAGNLRRCGQCGLWRNAETFESDHNSYEICQDCASTRVVCESCSNWSSGNPCDNCRESEDEWDENHEDDDNEGQLHDHGDGPDLTFHSTAEEAVPYLFLGVELETDKYDSLGDAIANLQGLSKNEELFWLQEDGSLTDGIEITSQPCTLAYHRMSMPWEKIVEVVRQAGGRSHDTNTCGLHIHFNRDFFGALGRRYSVLDREADDPHVVKLLYLTEKFWPQLVTFSRRTSEQLQMWAKKYKQSMRERGSDRIEALYRLKNRELSHYTAVNISNDITIEVRIFRGTLNLTALYAALELVDLLARTCRYSQLESLQKLSWRQFVKKATSKRYPDLNEYLINKGLKEDVNVHNHSEASGSTDADGRNLTFSLEV